MPSRARRLTDRPAGDRALAARLAAEDWEAVGRALDAEGHAVLRLALDPDACRELAGLWDDASRFRSRVDMARFRFGEGEYRYFAYPLPARVAALRALLYARLVPVANRWMQALRRRERYPDTLERFRAACRDAGQTRPTPLLLRYTAGGHNCLHRDLYGPLAFPLQATVLLGRPGTDFTGGEFLLVESRPRAQSRGTVVPLERGDLVVFATHERPVAGARGAFRAAVRHGVSTIRSGARMTLGVIFHDGA